MPGGQSDEVAPGSYHLVLRAFALRPLLPDYKPFRDEFRWLFNSYYNSLGEGIPEKHLRASLSRLPLAEVLAFRTHVDEAMEELFAGRIHDNTVRRIVLSLKHEQQREELMLTDIKHAFFSNPLRPPYDATPFAAVSIASPSDLRWHHVLGGIAEIGYGRTRQTVSTFASITKRQAIRSTWGRSGSQTAAPLVVSIWSLRPMTDGLAPSSGLPKAGKP